MFILQLNYGSVILYICSLYIEFISFCYFCIPAVNKGLNKWKNVIWGNVRSRKCHLGNCPSKKCLWGTVHRRKVHRANIRRGNVRWGNVHPGTVLEITLPMELLINHQLIPFTIRSKKVYLEQSGYERSKLSSFLNVEKQRPKVDLEKCHQCNGNIEIYLDLKVCFSLVAWKSVIKLG